MSGPVPLSDATLPALAGRLAVPSYDRRGLAPGVVHISVGSFHRAHQAVVFDDLAALGHRAWGIVGVGLHRPGMREALGPQDGLYTLVERGAGGDRARVVGAITRYLFAPEQWHEVLHALTDPRLHLVTLTVTGAGYKLGPDGGLLRDDPEVRRDLATPLRPASAIGHLVEGLARRRAAGLPPFTVLSCDNLPANGALARAAVVGLAAERDPGLAAWIDEEGAFPDSMVDRITPRTGAAERAWLAGAFGVDDRWPVVCEPFTQWVVQDRFAAARPPLEDAGVQVVEDVAPYALLKTRLLNASHCVLGHLGALAGLRTAGEAVAEPLLREVLRRLMADEVAPLLPAVPGVDVPAYREAVLQRLGNPVLGDTLERLRRRGSDKVPVHVLGSVRDARARRTPDALLVLGVAAWCRALRGTDDAGRPLALEDPRAEELQALARAGGTDPGPLLAAPGLFGDLAGDPAFAARLRAALELLEARGAAGAAAATLEAGAAVAA